ncbi:MAG: hypothetical protein B7L53_01665 [Thermofilum sp. NZ13]|nr:MAG: hypothetical protein B7L53_01665 [Thermofilum sp. NZ13]
MHAVVIGPRITPPWDSATASLAKSRLMLFTHPRVVRFLDDVSLLTAFRDYRRVTHFHENAFGNEVYRKYFVWLRQLDAKAYFVEGCDPDVRPRLAQFMLNYALHSVVLPNAYRILWYIGYAPSLPYLRRERGKVFVENFTLDWRDAVLNHAYIRVATSTSIYHAIRKRRKPAVYLPPAIDAGVFSPQSGTITEWLKNGIEEADVRLLYMGPLIRDRFPIEIIIPMLLRLKNAGYKPVLVALSTVRNRESLGYYRYINNLIRKHGLNNNLILKLRVLVDDDEKVSAYNSFDVLLYMPLTGKLMADPPITVLEAMSCGLPPVTTSIGDIGYIVSKYSAGIALSKPGPDILAKSIMEVINNKEFLSKKARRVIETMYSVEAVARLAEEIFTKIWGQ